MYCYKNVILGNVQDAVLILVVVPQWAILVVGKKISFDHVSEMNMDSRDFTMFDMFVFFSLRLSAPASDIRPLRGFTYFRGRSFSDVGGQFPSAVAPAPLDVGAASTRSIVCAEKHPSRWRNAGVGTARIRYLRMSS